MAITAAVAVAFAAVGWLQSLGFPAHVRVVVRGNISGNWFDYLDDRCFRLTPVHLWMTPVVFGGIGLGIWLSIFL